MTRRRFPTRARELQKCADLRDGSQGRRCNEGWLRNRVDLLNPMPHDHFMSSWIFPSLRTFARSEPSNRIALETYSKQDEIGGSRVIRSQMTSLVRSRGSLRLPNIV